MPNSFDVKIPFYTQQSEAIDWDTSTGQNKKHTLVLVVHSDVPGQLTFLKKVLRAVDLDFETDITFLPVSHTQQTRLLSAPRLSEFNSILSFGIDPQNIGLPVARENLPCCMHFEKCIVLCSPALSDVSADSAQKKALWSALKEIFVSEKA